MTAKHTPGPWSVLDNRENPHERGRVFVLADGGLTLAELTRLSDDDQRMANARLIAALPDLMAALSELVEAADYMRGTCGRIFAGHPEEDDTYIHEKPAEDYLKECADKARAIVAKATGAAQ